MAASSSFPVTRFLTRNERIVRRWNASQKVGAEVTFRRHDGTLLRTRTRSEARLFTGTEVPVVALEGIAGVVLLSRVSPLNLPTT